MLEKYTIEHFEFEDKETYERALKEYHVIKAMKKQHRLNGKMAVRLYQKAIEEKVFSTIVGYSFLEELRRIIRKTGAAKESDLAAIPVYGKQGHTASGTEEHPGGNRVTVKRSDHLEKYKRLYEGQCLLNRRLKIVVVALVLLVAAIVIIDLKSEYSVFTYFTDYKAKMEEELIDKYENWESELKAREDALEQKSQ